MKEPILNKSQFSNFPENTKTLKTQKQSFNYFIQHNIYTIGSDNTKCAQIQQYLRGREYYHNTRIQYKQLHIYEE